MFESKGRVVTRNKVLGSSIPHAVFVFLGGNGALVFPHSPAGPQAVVSGHAPAVGGRPAVVAADGLRLLGLRLAPALP